MTLGRQSAVFGVFVCLLAPQSPAQSSGRISGLVVDAQGAAIPGANVSLYLAGGSTAILTTSTSSSGNYVFSNVQPVTYDLTIEAKGFRKFVVRNVKVDPGLERAMATATLEVSSQAEIIEITAEAVSVQVNNAEIAATITNEQIRRLPTLNRSPLALIATQAGVGGNGRANTTINGLRPSFTNITIDGINVQDNFIRTNALDFLPNMLQLDQIAEMTISTSNTNAGMGNGAAQVAFVTPSGTNQYHGSLIWTNRNNIASANTWFNNRNGVKRPFLNQNQLGGSLRGRIIKDKLFFYTNYEATRLRQQTSATRTILRAAARQGIFTYRDTAGNERQVNVLQASGVTPDARMREILAKIPGPEFINRNDIGDGLNTGGYSFNIRNNRTRDNVTNRVDYIPSTNHSFTGTWLWNRDIVDRPDQSNDYRTVPMVTNDGKVNMVSGTWRWNPAATITNELRAGFNFAPALFLTAEDFGNGILAIPLAGNPVNTFRAQGRYTDTYNLQNNSNWFKDKHNFSFGMQGQIIHADPFNEAGNLPTWTIGMSAANTAALDAGRLPGVRSQDISIANSLLALHAGFISSASQTFNVTSRTSGFVGGAPQARKLRQQNWALYFNDTWKVSRRLTLTLGVRWEYYTPVDEANALILLPVLQNGNAIQTLLSNSTLDFAGSAVGRPWYGKDWNNYGPNVGIAWQPFREGKTVLRAGYSMNYPNDELIRSVDNNVLTNSGLSQPVTRTNLVERASSPPQLPTPVFRVPRTFADNYAVDTSAAFGMPDPNLRIPYVQQWNFSIQQEIGKGVLEVRYVGNHSTKQFRAFDYNQVQIGGGFLEDFQRARRNGELALAATGVFNPVYNPNIAGSQPLPFFAQLPNGGTLSSAVIRNYIQTGEAGELGNYYQVNRLNGNVSFYRNPVALGTNMMTNYSNANYNALQVDYRRTIRSAQIQANYVWARVLSDTAGDQQTRFEPFLDIQNARIERAPTVFDLRHEFKVNGAWQLPVGRGRRIAIANGVLHHIAGGWEVSGFLTMRTGSPFSILSGRGTLNRTARSSGTNTANTSLTWDQLKEVVRFRQTGNGPYMIAASAISAADGRGAAPDGQPAFSGQVFFNPGPGTLGALQRRMFTGPSFFNIDFAILKNFEVREGHRVEVRGEFFNLTNTPSFYIGDQSINSTTFGRITSTQSGRRIVQFGLQYRF